MAQNQVQRAGGLVVAAGGIGNTQLADEFYPRYSEAALAKLTYTAYAATVATSLPATATIGLTIWNPPGSGVRCALTKWTSNIVATSATCTGIGLAASYQTTTPTSVTAATATGSTFINQSALNAGQAKAYNIATVLVIPVVIAVLHHNTAAINTVGAEQMSGDLEGHVVLDQGGLVCFTAFGAAAAASAHTMSMMWIEIPIGS